VGVALSIITRGPGVALWILMKIMAPRDNVGHNRIDGLIYVQW